MEKRDLSDLVALRIVSATRVLNSRPHTVISRHGRPRWAIAYKMQGKTAYRFGEKEFYSDPLHPLLLPQGADYEWECLEAGECLMLEFESPAKRTLPIPCTLPDSSLFLKSFSKIEQNRSQGNAFSEPENLKEFYTILCLFLQAEKALYLPKKKAEALRPALDYLALSYRETGITSDSLAALCGISPVTFRKLFRAAIGISPIRYLKNIRMERAKELLSGDFASISQVAESVGYRSIYQFSKAFRRETGVSPGAFARRGRNEK